MLLIGLTGCLPVLVGGLIYKSSKTREQKQEFIASFRKTNADRESRGLSPLDWCQEVIRFDRGWAYEDESCRDMAIKVAADSANQAKTQPIALGSPSTE
jgi:hypothetical protein